MLAGICQPSAEVYPWDLGGGDGTAFIVRVFKRKIWTWGGYHFGFREVFRLMNGNKSGSMLGK